MGLEITAIAAGNLVAQASPPDVPPGRMPTASELAGTEVDLSGAAQRMLEIFRKIVLGYGATPVRNAAKPATPPAKATTVTPAAKEPAPRVRADEAGRRVYQPTLLPSGDPASREPVTRGGRN